MKIWVDDIRPKPKDYDHWCKTVSYAIGYISGVWNEGKHVDLTISLDHDLGGGLKGLSTGEDILKWIERQVLQFGWAMPIILVHSANPVARRRMNLIIQRMKERVENEQT